MTNEIEEAKKALEYLLEMANEGVSHHTQRGSPEKAYSDVLKALDHIVQPHKMVPAAVDVEQIRIEVVKNLCGAHIDNNNASIASMIGTTVSRLHSLGYLRAKPVPIGWQPIETAPRDGSAFALMKWDEQMPELFSAWWCVEDWSLILNDDDKQEPLEGESFSDFPNSWFWQTLPAPPSKGGA